jgi:hypothetical protein
VIKEEIESRLLDQTEVGVFRQIRLEALKLEPQAFASSYEDWVELSESEWAKRLADNLVFMAFLKSEPVGIVGLMRKKARKTAHIQPHLALSTVMQRIKGRSSRKIQMELPALKKRYWGRRFWRPGYFSTRCCHVN